MVSVLCEISGCCPTYKFESSRGSEAVGGVARASDEPRHGLVASRWNSRCTTYLCFKFFSCKIEKYMIGACHLAVLPTTLLEMFNGGALCSHSEYWRFVRSQLCIISGSYTQRLAGTDAEGIESISSLKIQVLSSPTYLGPAWNGPGRFASSGVRRS